MSDSLHPAIKEAYAMAPAEVSYVYTLEVRHASIATPLYLVQGFLHRQCTLEDSTVVVFSATGFNFVLPAKDESGLQELSITIDNVGNQVADFLDVAALFSDPVEVYFRPYLSTDLTTPQMDPPLMLFLTNATVGETQVSARCTPMNYLNMPFPNSKYTRELFPAIGN